MLMNIFAIVANYVPVSGVKVGWEKFGMRSSDWYL
jgi:hypothetical protein